LSPGITTLTGRVLDTDKKPLRNVTIRVGETSTTTDESGNFILENPSTGDQVVLIDGFTASTESTKYPTIPITMNIGPNQTNYLPYIPHLHAQKNYNFTPINPAVETIAEDPEIPGFQLRIPPGVDIIGWDGNPNTKVSVRRVPIDVLPVAPLPPGVQTKSVYMFYFNKQGGGVPDVPIPVTFPNDLGLAPGEKADLWYFNESPNISEAPNAWEIAGTGTVSDDGKTISTDPGVGIPRFCCGASFYAPRQATGPNIPPDKCELGDPVDASTGVFIRTETDLAIPGRIPIEIKRTYRTLDTILGPYGRGTYFSYDQYMFLSGGMATLVIPPGTRVSFYRQADGTFINTNEPTYRGARVTLNHDGSSALQMKDGMAYKFDTNGLLIEQTDRNGNRLQFLRGNFTDVSSIIGPDGRTMVTFSIHIANRDLVTEITDITGRKVTYTYDYSADQEAGRLMSVTNPEGGVTQYQYDTQGRMTSIIDPRGNTVLNLTYNINGRVCQEQYADGGAYKFYYITVGESTTPQSLKLLAEAAAGGPITASLCSATASNSPVAYTIAVDPNGNPTTFHFNSAQKIVSTTDSTGQTAITERDPATNLVTSRADVLGRTTRYTYDNNGNMTSITDPSGNLSMIEYDTILNKPTKITNALGNVTTMAYDSKGNLIELRAPDSELTTINYNQYGQPISVTDPMGNTAGFDYDDHGNLIKTTDPLGNSASMKYDPLSRLVESTDRRGRTTAYTYDLMNRMTELKDAQEGVTKFAYDLNANLLSLTDAKGQITNYAYNGKNKLIRMTDPLGKIETYEYDFNDNLIRLINRKGQPTRPIYDFRNRLKRIDYADGGYTEYTYDAAGRITEIYDSVSGSVQYKYSDTGCVSGCTGRPVDKVIQEITPLGSISYEYDALGRRTKMQVSGQEPVTYQYDPSSRLTDVNSIINGVAAGFSLHYDGAGRRTSLRYPNGMVTNYAYDNANRLLDLKHLNPVNQILESLNYTYDQNGNRTAMNRANVPVKLPDPASNITYNSANQMLTFNDKSMTYDENGNMTSLTDACGTTTYTWDARDRLTGITGFTPDCQPVTANFKYDALGRRIEKTINGRTIQYVYDVQDIVQGIENGAVTVNYIRTRGIDKPLARVESSGAIRYYQQDALGSVIALTDGSGNIKTQSVYDPFGNITIFGELSDNPFQYTGRENDETGLYYYRFRYYFPKLQRFISEDPIGLSGGHTNYFTYVDSVGKPHFDTNLYTYASNNPVNFIDPLGLWYYDVNVSLGKWIGATGGFIIGPQGIYPYLGGGFVSPPGGITVTWSPYDVTTGWNVAVQPVSNIAFQYGYSFGEGGGKFWEIGVGLPPGLSLTGFYVFQPWKWPSKNKQEKCK